MICRICSCEEISAAYNVKEMMYGTRENFAYFVCAKCGCMQIDNIPSDLSRYYGSSYYSYQNNDRFIDKLKTKLHIRISNYCHGERDIVGSILCAIYDKPDHLKWVSIAGASRKSRILDVGCGHGTLLRKLASEGFQNLTGADPFLSAPLSFPGVRIFNKDIFNIDGSYDFIMLNHSLEHIVNQSETMKRLKDLLAEGGSIMIRIPLIGKWAWRKYSTNWVQIDAPRHLYLHSEKSIEHLVVMANLRLYQLIFDSTEFQYWGSDLYSKGIPLYSVIDNRVTPNSKNSYWKMRMLRKKAQRLNQLNDGDQGCFFLKHAE